MSRSSLIAVAAASLTAAAAGPAVAGKIEISSDRTYPAQTLTDTEVVKKMDELGCLGCHSSKLLPTDGAALVGLGDNFSDRPQNPDWFDTVFGNPAIVLTAVLFSHLDPKTMAEVRPALATGVGAGLDAQQAPARVVPWWRFKHKRASFYIASGRGNRVTHMMIAHIIDLAADVDSKKHEGVELEEAIRDVFETAHASDYEEIAAWIRGAQAPKFAGYASGFAVDESKAAAGKVIFDARCAGCHATPGKTILVTNDHPGLGVDAALCTTPGNRPVDVDWFNASPFATVLEGEAVALDRCAYVAPPLDGIWTAAPYLHNGSIPTLRALLDSSQRPARWVFATAAHDGKPSGRRFDPANVGWLVENPDTLSPKPGKELVYDTTRAGYGNTGHTYGDALSTDERDKLIEYLKTL